MKRKAGGSGDEDGRAAGRSRRLEIGGESEGRMKARKKEDEEKMREPYGRMKKKITNEDDQED